jgi:hypothetical protein
MHFFPAMMLVPGVEEEYIKYMHQRTQNVESHYADKIKHLAPGTQVRYYKRDINPFQKSRGSTMSVPVSIVGRHTYKHHGNTKQGASYVLNGTVQRYLPYELEFVNKKNKISKPKNKTVLI